MKKLFKIIITIPFLFPFIYQFKYPVKNWGNFNLLDLFLILGISLSLFLIFKEKKWLELKKYFLKKRLLFGMFFLLFIFFITLFNLNNDWIRNLSVLKSFFILPFIWVFFISFFAKEKYLNLWWFFRIYFIYSLFLSILTILFKFLNITTFDNRISLFFESPNQLAIAISLGVIVTLLLGEKINKKFFSGLFLFLPALFLTQSTGSLLAIGLILVLFLNRKFFNPFLFLKFLFYFSIIFSIFLIILPLLVNPNFYEKAFENKNSFDSRKIIYLVSSEIVRDNFWQGIGPTNFQRAYLSKQSIFPPYPQWAVPHSHNLFIQIWISFGFIGLVLWSLFLYKKITLLEKSSKKVFSYFLIYFLIHGLIDVPIWNNDQALFFWFILVF